MKTQTWNLINEINQAIIQFRGIYSVWSFAHRISYNEMLVLYTLRDQGYCTQKQICDRYMLPRQTIHHVVSEMRGRKLLQYSREHSSGREKAFVLSKEGEAYAAPSLASLDEIESGALERLGPGKLQQLTQLLWEYDQALSAAMDRQRK